jgi:rhodanese-related sulfurtransferase
MGLLDYIKPVSSISVNKLRKLLEKKGFDQFNIVDVRQRREYETGHLPGALLIPVGDIASRSQELDPKKPTVAY